MSPNPATILHEGRMMLPTFDSDSPSRFTMTTKLMLSRARKQAQRAALLWLAIREPRELLRCFRLV
jgi:hypothetical protein